VDIRGRQDGRKGKKERRERRRARTFFKPSISLSIAARMGAIPLPAARRRTKLIPSSSRDWILYPFPMAGVMSMTYEMHCTRSECGDKEGGLMGRDGKRHT